MCTQVAKARRPMPRSLHTHTHTHARVPPGPPPCVCLLCILYETMLFYAICVVYIIRDYSVVSLCYLCCIYCIIRDYSVVCFLAHFCLSTYLRLCVRTHIPLKERCSSSYISLFTKHKTRSIYLRLCVRTHIFLSHVFCQLSPSPLPLPRCPPDARQHRFTRP
jgi:hypothetical protein